LDSKQVAVVNKCKTAELSSRLWAHFGFAPANKKASIWGAAITLIVIDVGIFNAIACTKVAWHVSGPTAISEPAPLAMNLMIISSYVDPNVCPSRSESFNSWCRQRSRLETVYPFILVDNPLGEDEAIESGSNESVIVESRRLVFPHR
jgi:hypothetical protein